MTVAKGQNKHLWSSNVTVTLPVLHADQIRAYRQTEDYRGGDWAKNGAIANGGRAKRKIIRAGRRWGKSTVGMTIAANAAAQGLLVGWFAPEWKFLNEIYEDLSNILEPVKRSSNRTNGIYRTRSGGRIDFWSLDNKRAGRSRNYHVVIIDEAGYTKPDMLDVWEQAIEPTLFDNDGDCWVLSNTNGTAPDNFLHTICTDPSKGFIEFHAPTKNNPLLPKRRPGESAMDHALRRVAAIKSIQAKKPPMVFAQEFEAEFVNWSGTAFFEKTKMLSEDGKTGVPWPTNCDYVYAVIDTAVKTGSKNDGTAVCYFARNIYTGIPIVVLDWDIVQVAGDLQDIWLAQVYENLNRYAKRAGARQGVRGAFIEDKQTGSILLMAAARRGDPAYPIPATVTAMGKDGRAINASGPPYRGEVKVTEEAATKMTTYKNQTRIHFWDQVCGFKVGVPNQQDDLLDCYTAGIAVALGNDQGVVT